MRRDLSFQNLIPDTIQGHQEHEEHMERRAYKPDDLDRYLAREAAAGRDPQEKRFDHLVARQLEEERNGGLKAQKPGPAGVGVACARGCGRIFRSASEYRMNAQGQPICRTFCRPA